MSDRENLISNIDKIHTTDLGLIRIKRNLKLKNENILAYCKDKIKNNSSIIYKKGKNFYVEIENIKLTINSYSYTIITAHVSF